MVVLAIIYVPEVPNFAGELGMTTPEKFYLNETVFVAFLRKPGDAVFDREDIFALPKSWTKNYRKRKSDGNSCFL